MLQYNVAPVVQKVDNAIHWICPAHGEQSVFLILNYLLDSVYPVASTIQRLNNWVPEIRIVGFFGHWQ